MKIKRSALRDLAAWTVIVGVWLSGWAVALWSVL